MTTCRRARHSCSATCLHLLPAPRGPLLAPLLAYCVAGDDTYKRAQYLHNGYLETLDTSSTLIPVLARLDKYSITSRCAGLWHKSAQ